MNVSFLDLKQQYRDLSAEIIPAVTRVLEGASYIMGREVEGFEAELSRFLGGRYAVCTASGTDALWLALRALGVGAGDEVITTPYTFFATAGAVHNAGARPVFADVQADTYNIDADEIEKAVTEKTKAIIPVHLFGQGADMDRILDIAKRYSLYVIEDACQAIGAEYKGMKLGTIGDIGCFSFFPTKNLGCFGDGGAVITNSKDAAEKIKMLRIHGAEDNYCYKFVGTNSRLDTLQAAVLLVKIKYLEHWINLRQKHAAYYDAELKGTGDIILPYKAKGPSHIYNQYVIRTKHRDRLRSYLKRKGIGTAVYYPIPLHLQECFGYLGYKEGTFPVSEALSGETLALPVYPELTEEKQVYIVRAIKRFSGR